MTNLERLKTIIFTPREGIRLIAWRWARKLVVAQVRALAEKTGRRGVLRCHNAWSEEDDFSYDVLCVQIDNLRRFVGAGVREKVAVAAEIGCVSDAFLREVDAERKIGVNVLPECIAQIESQGIDGVLSKGDGIPLDDASLDLVICFETIEHVPDPIAFLKELRRVVKPGGRLLVSVPFVPETRIYSRFYGKAEADVTIPEPEHHIFEFCPADFAKIVSHAGLRIARSENLPNYRLKYDPLTNAAIRRTVALEYFQSIQAYELVRKQP